MLIKRNGLINNSVSLCFTRVAYWIVSKVAGLLRLYRERDGSSVKHLTQLLTQSRCDVTLTILTGRLILTKDGVSAGPAALIASADRLVRRRALSARGCTEPSRRTVNTHSTELLIVRKEILRILREE